MSFTELWLDENSICMREKKSVCERETHLGVSIFLNTITGSIMCLMPLWLKQFKFKFTVLTCSLLKKCTCSDLIFYYCRCKYYPRVNTITIQSQSYLILGFIRKVFLTFYIMMSLFFFVDTPLLVRSSSDSAISPQQMESEAPSEDSAGMVRPCVQMSLLLVLKTYNK